VREPSIGAFAIIDGSVALFCKRSAAAQSVAVQLEKQCERNMRPKNNQHDRGTKSMADDDAKRF
jgi:hypothetical protein